MWRWRGRRGAAHCKPGRGGVHGPPPAGGCCGSHPSLREKARPHARHGDGDRVAVGTPAIPLTLIDGEESGCHRSKNGVVNVVTAGMNPRDHLQGAGALRHRHGPLRLAAGKAGSMAWPAATSTPCPARPHSREGDTGTVRWQHLHPHGPAAVVPVAVHHLDLQPENLQGSARVAVGQPRVAPGTGMGTGVGTETGIGMRIVIETGTGIGTGWGQEQGQRQEREGGQG